MLQCGSLGWAPRGAAAAGRQVAAAPRAVCQRLGATNSVLGPGGLQGLSSLPALAPSLCCDSSRGAGASQPFMQPRNLGTVRGCLLGAGGAPGVGQLLPGGCRNTSAPGSSRDILARVSPMAEQDPAVGAFPRGSLARMQCEGRREAVWVGECDPLCTQGDLPPRACFITKSMLPAWLASSRHRQKAHPADQRPPGRAGEAGERVWSGAGAPCSPRS